MKYKLGEFANITMGQSPKSEFYNFNGEGLPFLQGNRTFGIKYPTFDTWTTNVTKIANKNDIIMSVRAPVGDLNYAPEKLCLGRGVCSLRAKNNEQDFLFYLMKYSMKKLLQKQNGTVFGSVNRNDIENLEVDIPEFPTQKKIAGILSAIDSKIQENNKINDNLLQQAQTIYDELCTDCDYAKLEQLISAVETGSRPKGGAESSGIPSIGAEKIERFGTYDFSGEKYISEEYFSKLKRGIVRSGDVLLYKDGAYTGKVSMALDGFPHKVCAVNEHVFILRTKDNLAQFFLYFTLSSPTIKEKVYTLACGKAAQPGLNQQELFSVNVPMPSLDDILAFDRKVNPLMHAVALNALENFNLSNIRDSLLPKLLSGEIDVESIEL